MTTAQQLTTVNIVMVDVGLDQIARLLDHLQSIVHVTLGSTRLQVMVQIAELSQQLH